jgi:hypothetical protein
LQEGSSVDALDVDVSQTNELGAVLEVV